MSINYNGKEYEVRIIKKNIKHTYIRVKEDLVVYVTTNSFASNLYIKKLISDNLISIYKMIDRQKKKLEKKESYYLLGKKYDVILCNIFNNVVIDEDKIYTKNERMLEKFTREKAKEIFSDRLIKCYEKMNRITPMPRLIIKKMKQKWGYCNKRDELITLNLELIKYDIDEIDYVIVHELCHFIHFDHSKAFWECVSKYKPNYKTNRKVLREE